MKLKFYVFVLLLISSLSFAQNYNWITPNQVYLKLYIADDGIYRINKVDFTNAGVNPDAIDPRTVKVYYKGNQIPIYFSGEDDGTFNDVDFFDFFGKRNYGGLTNAYSSNNDVVYVTDEYFNFYSDTSAYWIGWGGAYGARFVNYNNTSYTLFQDYYFKKVHLEKDMVYTYGERINDQDYRCFNNEKFQGEGWFWSTLYWGNTITQNFTTPLINSAYTQSKLRVFAYPNKQSTIISNEHRLILYINNNLIDTIECDHFNKIDTILNIPTSLLNPSSVNTAKVKYINILAESEVTMNFDLFEVSYPRKFEFDSNSISFTTNSPDSSSKVYKIKGYNSSNPVSIYDVKNGLRIANYTISADTVIFTGKGDGIFEVQNKYITKKPARIKQRQVPNLVASANGADYLLVYNKVFETQAEQLRAYRNTHDGYRSFKSEVEDIIDIFNYGIEDPIAIRNFVKHAYNNWTLPRISYVCLFGRSSLDPKKNSSSSVYTQNYIPVYGNPPSDGYFVNMNYGTFTYYHQISVGRLPVYTTQEAQDVVNKIILYESLPVDRWMKNSVFISGGHYRSDQLSLMEQSDIYINSFIGVPPVSMNSTKIYLNDPSGTVAYNFSDSIKNSINRGAFFVSYLGHSSYHYWDHAFSNPSILSNNNMLPLIFSMTCFTGENAEAGSRGYGEQFLLNPTKGAIAFISTTGWSFFPGGGNVMENHFLNGFCNSGLRRAGEVLKFASTAMSQDSLNPAYRNTINSYSLLGDPALKLAFPTYPEFDINMSDYSLSNPFPMVRENVALKIFPKNLGTYADSCKIRFQILRNNQSHSIKDTIARSWGNVDSVVYNFKLDTVGLYSVKITLDIDNWYTQELTSNNSITIPINTKNAAFVPIKPIDNSIYRRDTVEFVGINPNVNTSKNTVKLILQLDTSKMFNSPMVQTHFNNNMTGAATKFFVKIPILDSNIVYYWRLNAIVNNIDTLGWSEIRRFNYNITLPVISSKKNKEINLTDNDYPLLPGDSNITVYKNKRGHYNDIELSFVNGDNSGLKIANYNAIIEAGSWGGDPWEATYYVCNNMGQSLSRQNIDWNGIFIARVNKLDGKTLNTLHVYLSTPNSSDSVLNFLNTFDSSHILIALKLISNGFSVTNLNTNTKNKFKQFGSTKIDSLDFMNWNWDGWSFISYPGNPTPTVSEKFRNVDWYPAVSSMTPAFKYKSGTITQTFGPAKTWKNFSWQQILHNGSGIKFDVYGIDRNNNESIIFSNLTSNSFVDLQSVNSYTYPYLKLVTKMNIDSVSGWNSSVLQSLKMNYVAPSELALDYNSVIKSDSIINGGDSLGISLAYYNVGYVDLYGYTREIYAYSNTGQKVVLKSDVIPTTLKIDSAHFVKTNINLNGYPNLKKYNNYIPLYFEVTPAVPQNDLYIYNNVTTTNVVVKGTSQSYSAELYSDGLRVNGGEYVRSKPDIEIKIKNNNITGVNSFDTSYFKLFINNVYQPYFSRTANGVRIEGFDTRNGNVSLKFNPALSEGESIFKLVTRSGQEENFDTVSYTVNVSNQLLIKDFYNFPNPMKNQTGFVFNLGGNSPPSGCKIKIYTVSGRLVKIINSTVNIGFNIISWDGRDNEGDYIANGVYFYRMIIEGDAKVESPIQKLVVLK